MADIAAAKEAIKARLAAGWATTRIAYENETPALPWPPMDVNAVLVPWVALEIKMLRSAIRGIGQPGNRVWEYPGLILVHVFVPTGSGDALANQYAVAIGELFRAAQFYDATPGTGIRSLSPSVDDGDDDGDWFRVTMACDFTYWHRA